MKIKGNLPLRRVISGADGFIGRGLRESWRQQGLEVLTLSRKPSAPGVLHWNPALGEIDHPALDGVETLVHLSGESLNGRWTSAKKKDIYDSRIRSTRLLVDTFAKLKHPPRHFLCASATGFYGDRRSQLLDETSCGGEGFLAEVCRDWESEANRASAHGVRVVNLRFGVVLAAGGGALARLLPLFKAGLGGRLGDGRQYMSWIALTDLYRAIDFIVANRRLQGPVNCTAPQPVTNVEFTRAVAKALRRPGWFAVPSWILRLAMGEMAKEMLLYSTNVEPKKLLQSGFTFIYPGLSEALSAIV